MGADGPELRSTITDDQGDTDRRSASRSDESPLERAGPALTSGHDVSRWRQSEITEPGLDQRGNVFFAAVEMTRMPMILTDPRQEDNPVVFANRAFQDLTGYRSDEIVGRNCRFLQGAHTDRDTVAELREAVHAQRAVSVEILNYKRDGTPFWNACFIGPVFDPEGRLLYFFASQLDVTRRRTSEQAFRQAQKMEAIGQLTAGLAHDFNNLLQVVAGNLDLLSGYVSEPRAKRLLDNATRATDTGARLTKQLLAFARKTRLDPQPTDINALVMRFGAMMESTVGAAAELRLDLRLSLPDCLIDPVHLEMALINILINARDAMPDGGTVTVSTSLRTLDSEAAGGRVKPGDYVVLAVRDEGVGMPPQVRERATEPFFTTKETGKGTGLGLAMAHGFVQQSLGRLEIDSDEGRGTTIAMLFPVARESTSEGRERRRVERVGTAPETGAQGRTILLVEDSEDVLALAQEHLEALGYRVVAASNGAEALRRLDEAPEAIDLLFTDLVMPGGMNGIRLAEEVRRRVPDVPVLFTTGYNEELVADGDLARDMDVIGKPYRRTDLADRIRAALARPSRTRDAGFGGHKEG